MTRALTIAAIEQCERDGHLFRWVRAWHDCGFYECDRCGETTTRSWDCVPDAEVGETLAIESRLAASRHELGSAFATALAGAVDRQIMAEIRGPWLHDDKSGKTCRIVHSQDGTVIGFDVMSGCTVRDCSPPSATVHNCPESVRRTLPDDSPLSAPPRGRGAPPKAQRNAEIVRRLAQGESVESVRQAFGLSWQRIYQIKEAAKRRPHTIGEPQGSATADG